MRSRCMGALVVAAVLLMASPSLAVEASSNDQMFAEAVAALQKGDYQRAIDNLEALADRGMVHPDVSYNRGLAYLARVRAKAGRPGDLGRAQAAFEETLLARPDDHEAEQAADIVRAEVARRRAVKRAPANVSVRPSLDRAIAGLAPEQLWAWLALGGSLVLTAGLLLRKLRDKGPLHVAAVTAIPIGLVMLVLFAGIAGLARHLRLTTQPAVVVASDAQMLDANGAATGLAPVPEAAKVEVLERRGALLRIRHGTDEGWTHAASVRMLMTPN